MMNPVSGINFLIRLSCKTRAVVHVSLYTLLESSRSNFLFSFFKKNKLATDTLAVSACLFLPRLWTTLMLSRDFSRLTEHEMPRFFPFSSLILFYIFNALWFYCKGFMKCIFSFFYLLQQSRAVTTRCNVVYNSFALLCFLILFYLNRRSWNQCCDCNCIGNTFNLDFITTWLKCLQLSV